MKKNCIIIILVFILINFIMSKNLNGDKSNLFSKEKKFKKGDIIFIFINESTIASQSNETDLSKQNNLNANAEFLSNLKFNGNVGFSNKNSGKGISKQSNLITTYLSAVVIDFKENGNLIIEGYKEIEINENKQKINFTGEINPIDVYGDNYIDSYKIANLKISYTGDGILANRVKPGIISQIFDWLRLF